MSFGNKQFRAPNPQNNEFKHIPFGAAPHALLSESLLLPSSQQPPPMFGPRGATIPPRFFKYNHYGSMSEYNEMNTSDNYWCETCDRGFRSHNLLQNHKKEHQTCNIDGCTFIAHPKVITKHIQMQHSSGLYKKISKLNDPEEIRKWIEERRKKFPTKENILLKKAVVHEKIKRGEKMGLQGKKTTDYLKREGNNQFRSKRRPARLRPKKNEKECPPPKQKHNLPAFAGISQLFVESDTEEDANMEKSNFVIDDDVDYSYPNNESNSNTVCGVITQLIADYGSSEDEDSSVNELSNMKSDAKKKNAEQNPDVILKLESSSNLKDIDSDGSGPEEIKTARSKEPIIVVDQGFNVKDEIVKQPNNSSKIKLPDGIKKEQKKVSRKLPSTLLEKLLSAEIKHERNVTLQCVRYIIKNNYFEK